MGKRIGSFLLAFAGCGALGAAAIDVVLTPPASGGVAITNAAGNATRFRVADDGAVTLNGPVYKGSVGFLHNFGAGNTFLGLSAGNFTMTGTGNTAQGANALRRNTTGLYNVAFGESALFDSETGIANTAIGRNALVSNIVGDGNIALGYRAGLDTTGNSNILIGNEGVAAEDGTIRIGSTAHNRAFMAGIRGKITGISNAISVMIDSGGQLGTISSSASTKDDIADMGGATSDLMKLRPVTFHYKADQDPAGRTLQYGLVAEEVAEIYPGLVARTPDGQVETVMYQFLPSMLLNEVQKQQRIIEAQSGELALLQREVAEMKQMIRRQP